MKILQLTAENIKKLSVVQITPDGNLVQITGKNGAGKTSVLDSIWWALAGSENVQSKPIRKGADSARIELKLGDGKATTLTVERRFTETASYLSVKTADGAKYPSPQRLLDDLLGTLTFDPLGFMRQDARGQFDVLRKLVKLDVDLDALDKANKADFEARTGVNRDEKSARAQAAGIVVPGGLPDYAIDEGEFLDEIQQAAAGNTKLEQRKAARVQANRDMGDALSEAKTLREQSVKTTADAEAQAALIIRNGKANSDAMIGRAGAADKKADDIKKRLAEAPELPQPTDIAALRTRLTQAKDTNAKIALRQRRSAILADAERAEKRSDELTSAIEGRKKLKLDAIQKAQMPVAGLSFGDGVLLFNDLPLDQASDAEQLMVSTAIAAALNPKLRVLRIRDGSLLDDDAMARLASFAKDRDMQIWVEVVQSDSPTAIWLEDGHVRGQVKEDAVALV